LEIGEKNRIVNYEMISGDSHIDLSWLPRIFYRQRIWPDSKRITQENLGWLEERVRRKVV
jgi:hypothetical protein